MTMIVPAGSKMPDWSPKETKMQKAASDGQIVQDQDVDALYEAAKGFVEAAVDEDKEECKECKKCGKVDDKCTCKDKQEKEACDEMVQEDAVVLDVEVDEGAPCEGLPCEDDGGGLVEVIDEVSDEGAAQSVSEAVAEVEAKAEEAEAVVQQVADAVDKIEEAVQEVKSVCGKDEVEIEVEEGDEVDEVEVDDEVEVPGEEVVDDEVVVEGKEAASKKVKMDRSASSEEFCRFAKLSPQNRKKLANYWTNMLGYPRDYVSLMTKDYEK